MSTIFKLKSKLNILRTFINIGPFTQDKFLHSKTEQSNKTEGGLETFFCN